MPRPAERPSPGYPRPSFGWTNSWMAVPSTAMTGRRPSFSHMRFACSPAGRGLFSPPATASEESRAIGHLHGSIGANGHGGHDAPRQAHLEPRVDLWRAAALGLHLHLSRLLDGDDLLQG